MTEFLNTPLPLWYAIAASVIGSVVGALAVRVLERTRLWQ